MSWQIKTTEHSLVSQKIIILFVFNSQTSTNTYLCRPFDQMSEELKLIGYVQQTGKS